MGKKDDNKNSFIFYEDWLSAIENLQESMRLPMFMAIARYAFYGEEPENKEVALMLNFVKGTLDRNADKYSTKKAKYAHNGKKGGDKRAENMRNKKAANASECSEVKQSLQSEAIATNRSECSKSKQSLQNVANVANSSKRSECSEVKHVNVNVNDNVNVTVLPNGNDNNNTSPSNEVDVSAEADAASASDAIDYKKIVDSWNSKTNGVMGKVKYPLGPSSQAMVRARVRQYGMDAFMEMIDVASRSTFMHGTKWAKFQWCIKPDNFPKVLQGDYLEHEAAVPDKNINGRKKWGM